MFGVHDVRNFESHHFLVQIGTTSSQTESHALSSQKTIAFAHNYPRENDALPAESSPGKPRVPEWNAQLKGVRSVAYVDAD